MKQLTIIFKYIHFIPKNIGGKKQVVGLKQTSFKTVERKYELNTPFESQGLSNQIEKCSDTTIWCLKETYFKYKQLLCWKVKRKKLYNKDYNKKR